ncbi:TnsA-like heteromeric transposase endonuclease subunit [Streptomyces lateritius]|uniref:TnsA-like heteromeric transposase endonuclease subunit n=1 Tax=Streptomyces lateritius TaxID=67313 RepID=UPI0021AB31B4|nr:TnsA-like heteromeric transposase endonuclease subunit [Streptomyces lateritius]
MVIVWAAGVERGELWSHRCSWEDLLLPTLVDSGRGDLDQREGWTRRWTATWRYAGGEVVSPVANLAEVPIAGRGSMRWFSWRRAQRHRPGLEYLVSTGRMHGCESLEEARLLLVLDFAADLVDVLSQPLKLRFRTTSGWREHTPDFLVATRAGVCLIDVRPVDLIKDEDRESFAAAAEAALVSGWNYVVAAEWRPHVLMTIGELSARRRPLSDPLDVQPGLLAQAAEQRTFGELAAGSACEPVARAHLLHLLWNRRLGVDLRERLEDCSPVVVGKQAA